MRIEPERASWDPIMRRGMVIDMNNAKLFA